MTSSLLASAGFKEHYAEDISNESYVNTLFRNVLGRDCDQAGHDYWLGKLSNDVEPKHELLLGFIKSGEKRTFPEITGFY